MRPISHIPLPSISLVLSSDHARIPRRPSVIKMAATPIPRIQVHPPQDEMEESDLGDGEASPYKVDLSKYHEHRIVAEDDDNHMELAESLYEEPGVSQTENFVVVKLIKEKITNVLFSFRRLLCVDLPQTCFSGVTRQ